MAVPLHFSPQASHNNCATKVSTGLKSQSTSLFSSSTPNLTVEFYQKVNKSLQIRSGNKRRGGAIMMMPLGVPYVLYKTPGENSQQWMDIWNAFYRERIVFIGQPIYENFANITLATLLYLDTLGSEEPICLYINSPGGDIHSSMALYDTIRSLQTPVGTYCLGMAGDMAAFILAAGDKGKRVAMPLAHIIVRDPAALAQGRADDVQVEAQKLIRIKDYLVEEFAKHTGQPVEKVYKDLSSPKHFDTDKAIAYGIIDRCVRPAGPAPKDEEQKLPPRDGSVPPRTGLGLD